MHEVLDRYASDEAGIWGGQLTFSSAIACFDPANKVAQLT